MKSFLKKIRANIVPISQIVLLAVILCMPSWLNVKDKLVTLPEMKVSQNVLDYILFWAWEKGNLAIGLVLLGISLFALRKINKKCTFNKGNEYKDYPYSWYWICSKILGYSECNLKLVPIYMQFKLILRDTFDKYICGEYPKKIDDKIETKRINLEQDVDEINIMIADTYELSEKQLPSLKVGKPTIVITRDNKNDYNRYDSPELVQSVVNTVRGLPEKICTINVYAATNPLNTKKIVQEAFKLGGRDIIKSIFVFQQSKDGIRKFEDKGIRVYKR